MGKTIGKEILVDMGEKKELGRLFGVSFPTVYSALKYKTRTATAYKIRKAALERGGVEAVIEVGPRPPTL